MSPEQTPNHQAIRTVLFDLDGTLLDTAPDLANALNTVLAVNGRQPLPFETIRPVVSHGGRALVELGFALKPEDTEYEPIRQEFLDVYLAHIAEHTRPFPGMEEVLDTIELRGMRWGVVTNKPHWLTDPLLDALDLTRRAACVVCGDTLNESKPHPAPLIHACRQTGNAVEQCVYVGDAERDIIAGRRAGMPTLVALFGYIGADDDPEQWGASALVTSPQGILNWLEARTRQQS
ncbi:MAG: phosphoglycolate phosphatase [Pseudomonadota bacterium]|nr:MAG: phosphoglycolate phosphatase [Pseudomonadota bacterium]